MRLNNKEVKAAKQQLKQDTGIITPVPTDRASFNLHNQHILAAADKKAENQMDRTKKIALRNEQIMRKIQEVYEKVL